MKVSRDDLWVNVTVDAQVGEGWATVPRKLTPEEFAEIATAEGYVKLDVDVGALRKVIEAPPDPWKDDLTDQEIDTLWKVARQVLAALDGEET